MKPYPEYKPTGLAWLPEIPKHWKSAKIRELFTERIQKVSDKEFAPLSVSKGGIVPQIATVAKTDNGDNRKRVKVGDFVINSRSDRKGSSGISAYDGSVSLINIVLNPRAKENGRFLHYLLKSIPFTEEYYRNGRGIVADLWTTRYSEMKTISVPVPPADEQAQIVRYLDAMTAKINKLIRAKKRQIALLQEQKQAIINQAVTRGLDPEVELKDSGVDWLGPIPKQWEIKTVKQYFKIRKQIAGHEGYDVLSITQDGIKIKDISTNEGQMAMSYAGYQLVRPGDFAMNHMDLLTGYVDRSNYFGVTSPDYRVFELCDNVNCHPDFFLYVFQLYYKRRIFYRYGRGAASVGRWRLPAREFLNFVIPVPPIISQKRIVRFVKNNTQNIDKNILAVESQIKILSEYKNSLIAAVVTGKVDVRNIAVEAVPPEDLAPSDDPDESEEQDSLTPEESEE